MQKELQSQISECKNTLMKMTDYNKKGENINPQFSKMLAMAYLMLQGAHPIRGTLSKLDDPYKTIDTTVSKLI